MMIVHEVEDARSIRKREEETSRVLAKVPSPFLVCLANLKTKLDKNFVNIETRFLLSHFGSFFSKIIDFSLQHSLSPETSSNTGIGRNFCKEDSA